MFQVIYHYEKFKKGITLNLKENTKEQLGVIALIAIMEPLTESQSSGAYKQPWSCHSSKIKVLLTQGPMEILISYQKERQTLSLSD